MMRKSGSMLLKRDEWAIISLPPGTFMSSCRLLFLPGAPVSFANGRAAMRSDYKLYC